MGQWQSNWLIRPPAGKPLAATASCRDGLERLACSLLENVRGGETTVRNAASCGRRRECDPDGTPELALPRRRWPFLRVTKMLEERKSALLLLINFALLIALLVAAYYGALTVLWQIDVLKLSFVLILLFFGTAFGITFN